MLRLCWLLAEALAAAWRRIARLPREAAAALGAPAAGLPRRPARLWLALGLVLPVALAAAWLLPQVRLVMSPSIPAWAVRTSPGPIERGDYVMFTLRHPIAGPRPVSVTKRALCLPGDRLATVETPSPGAPRARDGHYFCNGALLGVSRPFGPHGLRLDHLRWSGVIPPGKAYVGSDHPRGFDSRYFGLVPLAALTRMERLL